MKNRKLHGLTGVLWIAVSISTVVASADDLVPNEEYGLRLTQGFDISLHADSDLASDIYAMTLNSKGEAVVTSRGYIKTLHDDDNDGKADRATVFAETATGGMGLCFDGDDLLFVGDGGLWRYRDRDADGRADGPPEKLLSTAFAEHGGHAIRRGPDGYWYLIGGNDSGLVQQFADTAHPQNPKPEAGALIRLSPDFKTRQLLAHGFRNPYDFDFNSLGEIFTYDADGEREFLLPWYTPTRIFHVQKGAHHGWRLDGYQRSWSLPDYYADVANILAPIGRGSPTGVASYRHSRFPRRYQNGVFALDWTFGRIWFLPLRAIGASYRATPEAFLEPLGSQGFAPSDICVTPDGALLVSIGGRKTRGAVFRIDLANASAYRRNFSKPEPPDNILDDEVAALDFVLSVPQPLDAWSRTLWLPLAQQLGEMPLKRAVVDEKRPVAERIRAVEIATELFGGLETPRAMVASQDTSPMLRARVAWSLGVKPCEDVGSILLKLTGDTHPLVRRCALEALKEQRGQIDPAELTRALVPNLAYRDHRVRHAAIQIASLLPGPSWDELQTLAKKAGRQPELSVIFSELWREKGQSIALDALAQATAVLERTFNAGLRLQALRLAFVALGDFNIHKPSVEVYAEFETVFDLAAQQPELRKRLTQAVLASYPSGDATLDRESARLLAVLRDESPETAQKTAHLITENSSPAADVHYLVALSRLPGLRNAGIAPVLARRIVGLDQKLAGLHLRGKQNWAPRLAETVAGLAALDPEVADELILQPQFATAGHVDMALTFDNERQVRAAQVFKKAVEAHPDFRWEASLVLLLGKLPTAEVHPLLRRQWSNHGLRDELVLQLAREPLPEDEEKFLFGLTSTRNDVAQASVRALSTLPRQSDSEKWRPLVRLLDRLIKEPNQKELRAQTVALLNRYAGQQFSFDETKAHSPAEVYAPVFRWIRETHPELLETKDTQAQDAKDWQRLLQTVSLQNGNAGRGAELFRQRACESCHGGGPSFGPDLGGAAGRFSAEDLLTAIASPSRDIAPAYQPVAFVMKNGATHTGIVSFESADGVILQTGPATSVRLADADIAERKSSDVSLMPAGLLSGLSASDLADLYAFLKTLK